MDIGDYQHLIIAGTAKAATSSLFDYISAHPEVCGSRVKETYFFSQGYSGNPQQDSQRYATFFAPDSSARVLFEASPNYLGYKEDLAPRIRQLLPDARLLFVLRDPAERLYSQFNFARGKLELPRDMSFEQYVDVCEAYGDGRISLADSGIAEKNIRALEIGHYARYLQRFYDRFDASNILILFFEQLRADPLGQVVRIAEFTGISPEFFHGRAIQKSNVSFSARNIGLHALVLKLNLALEPALRRNPRLKRALVSLYKRFNRDPQRIEPMAEDTRTRLQEYYRSSNRKLRELFPRQELPPWVV